MRTLQLIGLPLLAALVAGCTSSDAPAASGADAGGAGLATEDSRVHGGIALTGPFLDGDCDPMVPTHCGFPFPSNVWLAADDSTPTGRHVEFGATTLPRNSADVQAGPDEFRKSDGFSAGVALMTHLPGATITGLASPLDIERSITDDSPTIVIDAETFERIPHFAELDVTSESDDTRAFMIRPVVRLRDGARYIVAIRRVRDASGDVLPPSGVFRALRDGSDHDDPSVSRRRELYADVFARLDRAGVARDDLQLAWDFTTASLENNTRQMLHMRDEALAALGPDGPEYRIETVTDDYSADVLRRIDGWVRVPLYLDKPEAGGRLVLGDDGLPRQNGTAEYPFLVLIPRSVSGGTPAKVVQNGHGLFGTRQQAEGYANFSNVYGWSLVATDFIGMASDDVATVATVIGGGDIGAFRAIPDRMNQGFLNMMLVTRLMRGAFANDPAVQVGGKSAIDTTESFYFGGSEGGILGATFMALSTDVLRGDLAVAGQPYDLLLNRSVDFDGYWALIKNMYPNPLDVQLLLALAQMLWDRGEPSGYSHHIVKDPLPGTPAHEVLLQLSIGDHQVTTLGGHVMARSIGLPNLKPVNRPIFGIPEVDAPHQGSAMIEYDFGNPPEPITNVPARDEPDPHGRMTEVPAAGEVIRHFFETGEVDAFCEGKCDPG